MKRKILELVKISKELRDKRHEIFGWKTKVYIGDIGVRLYYSKNQTPDNKFSTVRYTLENRKTEIGIYLHNIPNIGFPINITGKGLDLCIERAKELIDIINKRENNV